jgi:hypothetical protein
MKLFSNEIQKVYNINFEIFEKINYNRHMKLTESCWMTGWGGKSKSQLGAMAHA